MDLQSWLSLVGTGTLVSGVAIGLWQYRRAQAWKRAEFAAQEVRRFFGDARVKNALAIIDYRARRLRLAAAEGRSVPVDAEVLKEALRPHDPHSMEKQFTQDQIALRDTFDQFLDGLEQFDHFIETGLVGKRDFHPYLRYWLHRLGDREAEPMRRDAIDAIWRFAQHYQYSGAQRLFARYGYDVQPAATRVPIRDASPATPPPAS